MATIAADLSFIAEPLRHLAIPIGDLHQDPNNARLHPEANLDAIAASLQRFGQRLPIVVQKQGMVIRAGNGRLEAAKRLGWSHLAAVVVDESEVEATAYAIADNRTPESAEWNDEILASLLQSLPEDRELGVLRQTLIWVKDSMVLGHSDYHYKHETIYYGWTPGGSHREPPTRTCTSVLEFPRPKASRDHPTMKPIELWAFLLTTSSGLRDRVYEPFSGSGTTIIACEQLGRKCYAIEIEPRYVDVAVRRWEKLTGKQAVHAETGRTWTETAADRGVTVG